jgi:hypothetical protein
MDDTAYLAPCPFCMGEADVATQESDGAFMFVVLCRDADCGGGVGGYDKEEEAVERWNRRCGSGRTLH